MVINTGPVNYQDSYQNYYNGHFANQINSTLFTEIHTMSEHFNFTEGILKGGEQGDPVPTKCVITRRFGKGFYCHLIGTY